jgi:hypothetical protein
MFPNFQPMTLSRDCFRMYLWMARADLYFDDAYQETRYSTLGFFQMV